jgi:hypothetical protein
MTSSRSRRPRRLHWPTGVGAGVRGSIASSHPIARWKDQPATHTNVHAGAGTLSGRRRAFCASRPPFLSVHWVSGEPYAQTDEAHQQGRVDLEKWLTYYIGARRPLTRVWALASSGAE